MSTGIISSSVYFQVTSDLNPHPELLGDYGYEVIDMLFYTLNMY